jgi:integrase
MGEPGEYTLSELISRYYDDVHTYKAPKTQRREVYILRYWNDHLGHRLLNDLQPKDIIHYRDRLSTTRKPGTIHIYLAVLSHVFTTAVREYQWLEQNPCSRVSKPPLPQGRVRYLTDEERSKLLSACQESKNPYLSAYNGFCGSCSTPFIEPETSKFSSQFSA